MSRKFLIVGGGVAGTAMAIQSRKRGIDTDLIDISTDWAGQGAGITITGPTLRAFKAIGILDEFFKYGAGWHGGTVFDKQGNQIDEIETHMLEEGLPGTAGIHRADLHKIMTDKAVALGARVHLGTTLEDLVDEGDKVRVTFSDGRTDAYDLVVGADGVFSGLRRKLLPESGAPQYTGQACWRIVADLPAGMDRSFFYMGENGKIGFSPTSDKECYMFLLEYAPSDPWREPEEQPQILYDLMEGYGGVVPEVRAKVLSNKTINYRPLKGGVVPRPWKKGRVVFAGDAVHGPTPHLASGAGMAAEDAVVLDEELAKTDDIHAALQAYEDRRFPRCKFIVESSIQLGQMEIDGADPHAHAKLMQDAINVLRQPI